MENSYMIKVNLKTKKVTREQLPKFLKGLNQESLNDLSWTDPQLGLQDFGYWQEQRVPQELTSTQKFGNEVLEVDTENKVVKVSYEIIDKTAEELEAELNELFSRLRIERDTRINSVFWMRERHADELELGKGTSLTPEQYIALLTYIQALRDIPQQEEAPWDGGGEQTPWPIKPV